MVGRGYLRMVLLAALAAGCGGGDDDDAGSTSSGLAGVYETLSDDYYQPCDGDPTSTGNEPPYFQIVDEALLNGVFITVYRCTSGDPASCDNEDTGNPLIFLAEQMGSGTFRQESSSRTGTDTDCTANFYVEEVKKSAEGVTLTTEELSDGWTGADCAGEFTDALVEKTKTLPCFQREIRKAKLVP